MKWFVFLGALMSLYCYLLLSITNMMLNATQQLSQQYQTAAAQVESIANSTAQAGR